MDGWTPSPNPSLVARSGMRAPLVGRPSPLSKLVTKGDRRRGCIGASSLPWLPPVA
jgi:hypothetical protein